MEPIPLAVIYPDSPIPLYWMRFEALDSEYEYDLEADEVVLAGTIAWSFRRLDREEIVKHWVAPMVVHFPWP